MPSAGHPIGNAVCSGKLAPDGALIFAGGRIDALALCEGQVLRTARPDAIEVGLAHARRHASAGPLRLLHLVFAPFAPRPLLFSLVELASVADRIFAVDYSELWDVTGDAYRAAEGACVRSTLEGMRALADAASGIRTRPPEPPPRRGLALEARVVLPPGARRLLAFAFAAPPPEEDAGALVRAWRGEVLAELEHTVAAWLKHLGPGGDQLARYRQALAVGAQ